MNIVFDFFSKGWVGSLIGLVGIILGIIGIFSYRVSRSVAKPSYQKSALRLIGENENNLPSDVTVTYKGNVVEKLTKTTLVFWNNGTEIIDGINIVEKDPLCISFDENDKILNYKILESTKQTNDFNIEELEGKQNQLILRFDYLDPKDGAVIELLHDSARKYPIISGTIKGVPNGFVDHGGINKNEDNNYKYIFRQKFILLLSMLLGLLSIIFGLLPSEIKGSMFGAFQREAIDEMSLPFIITGLVYASLPAWLLWIRRRKYPKHLHVSELES